MNCPKCDTEIQDDALFCHRCGQSLDAESDRQDRSAAANTGSSAQRAMDRVQSIRAGAAGDDDREDEIWKGGYSPKAMIAAWIGMAVLTVVALVGGFFVPYGWLVGLGLVAIGWLFLALRLVYMKMNVSYLLTTQRFVHESGILRRVTDRVEVIDVDDVTFEQGLIDRMVGVGTIKLTSSDRSHAQLVLKGIDDVKTVADRIDAARRKERVRRGLHIEAI